MAQLEVTYWSREAMLKRVARFDRLKGSDGGLPDSRYPESIRTLYNVIGFQPPEGEGEVHSPVGAEAARMAAIPIREGFNLGFCRCKSGKGPLMHNHDTNETFIALTGVWRASWESAPGKVEWIDLKPYDVVSFPPGVPRRFENVTPGDPELDQLLLFVIGGDSPMAEFTPAALELLAKAGLYAPA
ncbi:MAG: cupin domain-containing protein [Proteobacteria bacterium]|nr:cupin domain-containing protein [Pseudomonadota bacterium]MBI3497135.1 cupin domain-containing protein [Pseudomonadota bacterium]